jgi:hypothetical protein
MKTRVLFLSAVAGAVAMLVFGATAPNTQQRSIITTSELWREILTNEYAGASLARLGASSGGGTAAITNSVLAGDLNADGHSITNVNIIEAEEFQSSGGTPGGLYLGDGTGTNTQVGVITNSNGQFVFTGSGKGLSGVKGLGSTNWSAAGSLTFSDSQTDNSSTWRVTDGVHGPAQVTLNSAGLTAPAYYGDGSHLTGIAATTNTVVNNVMISSGGGSSVVAGYTYGSTNADYYISRLGITSPDARGAVHNWFATLQRMGIESNLVDFAFFDAASRNGTNLLSLSNTVYMSGANNLLPGGIENNPGAASTNNFIYVTNLPATPNGRTLVTWLAPAFDQGINSDGLGYPGIASMIAQMSVDGGSGYSVNGAGIWYNGSIWSPCLRTVTNGWWASANTIGGPGLYNGGSVLTNMGCWAMAVDSTTSRIFYTSPTSGSYYNAANTDGPWVTSPTVLRLGGESWNPAHIGWWGVYRGFALFNKMLSSNEMYAVDTAVQKIGLIAEGDSKSCEPKSWPTFLMQSSNYWGLMQMLTNSSVSGTAVTGAGNTMINRWPADSTLRPSSTFPTVIYAIRGGLHDIADVPGNIRLSDLENGMSNILVGARSAGIKTAVFTVEPTYLNTNAPLAAAFTTFNTWLRSNPSYYDWLIDADNYYRNIWGSNCWQNASVFGDGVHETSLSYRTLGSNLVANAIGQKLFRDPAPAYSWEIAAAVSGSTNLSLPSYALTNRGSGYTISGGFSGGFTGSVYAINQRAPLLPFRRTMTGFAWADVSGAITKASVLTLSNGLSGALYCDFPDHIGTNIAIDVDLTAGTGGTNMTCQIVGEPESWDLGGARTWSNAGLICSGATGITNGMITRLSWTNAFSNSTDRRGFTLLVGAVGSAYDPLTNNLYFMDIKYRVLP